MVLVVCFIVILFHECANVFLKQCISCPLKQKRKCWFHNTHNQQINFSTSVCYYLPPVRTITMYFARSSLIARETGCQLHPWSHAALDAPPHCPAYHQEYAQPRGSVPLMVNFFNRSLLPGACWFLPVAFMSMLIRVPGCISSRLPISFSTLF